MTRITEIVSAIDRLLEPERFRDLGPNGLQVPSAHGEVSRVVTGVSAQRELVERAVERGAQMVLVHHGLFWDFKPTGLSPVLAERLRPLFVHDVALAAYHLPLDAHPEVGNNAILANRLGCASHDAFGDFRGTPVGRVREVTGREPTVQGAGPERVRRIGIVSGSAADALDEAVERGLDAFLTGEPREHVMADAREAGIHFIAAGHYAPGTFCVQALGDWLPGAVGL